MIFCGCQSGKIEDKYETFFESDVVRLLNYTVERKKDRSGTIVEITVSGTIENIVDRKINILITAEFYDERDEYIGESSIRINYLASKPHAGSSTSFPPPYIIYKGKNVEKVDRIKLRAEEV